MRSVNKKVAQSFCRSGARNFTCTMRLVRRARKRAEAARSADVTFTAEGKTAVVKISQTAPVPTLEVSPATLSIDYAGGPLEVNVLHFQYSLLLLCK